MITDEEIAQFEEKMLHWALKHKEYLTD